ncbi:MAG: tRNA (adenosine(37)-N6)-threonylcarbamoyltransferase complex dimerization subunit type 1 TsaB [Oscillospiraceae bacterium]|jgi:tRNA threonylcarbamoyladenosine biosynthesis protein TsaB|nr:tRNA (adenosine(37)-N6)-threonylcarbamoyltransferase complex dimerization subunit type 1 TsaB [Oscillospiraceae bacterium]
MIILFVDSSNKSVSVAILEEKKVLGEFFLDSGLTHSQTLAPMIDSLLKCTNVSAKNVDLFSAVIGPGSFTGIRIGVSTINGMALAFQKKCMGMSSLLALTYNVGEFEGLVCSCIHSREDEVYAGIFEKKSGKINIIIQDRVIKIFDLIKMIKKYKKKTIFVGSGSLMCYNEAQENFSECIEFLSFHDDVCVRASNAGKALFDCVSPGRLVLSDFLEPNYLKLTKAEKDLNICV